MFDLFKAFDWIENSHKLDFFVAKKPIFFYVGATNLLFGAFSVIHSRA